MFPTAGRLRALLQYDPVTGILKHALKRSGVVYGSVAGNKSEDDGYIRVYVDSRNYLAHRLIWCIVHGREPINQLDHINRDRTDNRLINLREATNKQNSENHPVRSDCKSGVTGVCWSPHRNKWRANIYHFGKQRHLGYYSLMSDAIAARIAAINSTFTHSELQSTPLLLPAP